MNEDPIAEEGSGKRIWIGGVSTILILMFLAWLFTSIPDENSAPPKSSTDSALTFGQTVTIRRPSVCAPTKEGLDAVIRWAGVNRAEFLREIGRTGAVLLGDGDQALMLDPGILRHQIRLSNGEDCWVYREALEP